MDFLVCFGVCFFLVVVFVCFVFVFFSSFFFFFFLGGGGLIINLFCFCGFLFCFGVFGCVCFFYCILQF